MSWQRLRFFFHLRFKSLKSNIVALSTGIINFDRRLCKCLANALYFASIVVWGRPANERFSSILSFYTSFTSLLLFLPGTVHYISVWIVCNSKSSRRLLKCFALRLKMFHKFNGRVSSYKTTIVRFVAPGGFLIMKLPPKSLFISRGSAERFKSFCIYVPPLRKSIIERQRLDSVVTSLIWRFVKRTLS